MQKQTEHTSTYTRLYMRNLQSIYPKWTEIQSKETGLSTIPLLFNIVLEALAGLIRQKKEIEEINIRKVEINFYFQMP